MTVVRMLIATIVEKPASLLIMYMTIVMMRVVIIAASQEVFLRIFMITTAMTDRVMYAILFETMTISILTIGTKTVIYAARFGMSDRLQLPTI